MADGAEPKGNAATADVVVIKKYANRRLYNTRSSSYITLDHLAKMTREGVEYKVLDAKSGTDITHQILTQIILEEESSGEQMLPVNFLRQLIGMYGNSMQSLIPHYLEASMDSFRANQTKLAKAFEDSLGNNPLARLAERNMAMFKAATSAFIPEVEVKPDTGGMGAAAGAASGNSASGNSASGSSASGSAASPPRDDIAVLREQMIDMQKKLDALGQ